MNEVNTVIVGGGPAGTGLILKSMKDGAFEQLASKGLVMIESSDVLVAGSITQYQVNSDTMSDVFLECLEGQTSNYLPLDALLPYIHELRAYQGRNIPLPLLHPFLKKIGTLLAAYLENHPACKLYLNAKATKIVKLDDGRFKVIQGDGRSVTCRNLVMANGASSIDSLTPSFKFAGKVDLSRFLNKTIISDNLLRGKFVPDSFSPKVVILGGNHSAFSAAEYLLRMSSLDLGENSIRIWTKEKPKLFFRSKEEALLNSYTDFTDNDICQLTKRVFRLAGLRMDGRQLYMNMLGMGKALEKRVSLHIYREKEEMLLKDLEAADLVIHAFGYRFNMPPFLTERNIPVELSEDGRHLVNSACQVKGASGSHIPGLFATGLATGYVPSGDAGGESSFKGQTNGFWYYQNVTAALILDGLKMHNESISNSAAQGSFEAAT